MVRAHREQAGISQEALAFKAGLHRTYVSMLERGVRSPTLMVIDKLSRALDTTMGALMTEVEARSKVRR